MDPALDRAPCLYFTFGEDNLLQEVNDTLCRYLGFSKEELQGQKVDTIFTLPTRIFCQTHFFPLLQMHGHAEEIFMTLSSREKDYVPVLLNAKRDAATGLSTGIAIPVPNRKKFEDELVAARKAAEDALLKNTELQKAKEELQAHAEQLDQQFSLLEKQHSELRQFNRAITHDLQEPLRKLLVFGNMLQETEKASLPPETQKLLDKLLQVVNQMRAAVSGLQQYVWLNETGPKFGKVDLNNLLLLVRQDLDKEEEADCLVLEMDELPAISADWDQIYLLFRHLLQNAVKFRKEGSRAHVQVRGTVLQHNRFRHLKDKYKYEEYFRLEIRDEGIGFDPAYNQQVFDLFKRLHNRSGKGLGLSLSKKIVEGHGGTITARSQPGKGTTISILLPVDVMIKESAPKQLL